MCHFYESAHHSHPLLPHQSGSLLSASPCMQPVTSTPLSICTVVTLISRPSFALSRSAPVCPPAVWPPAAAALLHINFLYNPFVVVILVFQDGMGKLHLNQDGIHLDGISEFFLPFYVNEIQSRRVSCSFWSGLLINTLVSAWGDPFKAADEPELISQC